MAEAKCLDAGMFTAWHTARFALNGYADKGRLAGDKTLADLLSTGRKGPKPQALQAAEAVAFFHRLKSQGFPVSITRH